MTDSTKSVSPLRQRMIDDMTMRKLAPKTQAGYLRSVKNFTRFFGRSPDRAGPEDLRRFQLHLVEKGTSSTTLNATITALKFFYGVTLDRPSALKKMSPVRKEQRLPYVLSVEEVTRLLNAAATSSTGRHCRWPMVRVYAPAKSPISRWATSIASV